MKLKWIFAALVLVNLGLWMWSSWYKETPVEETRTASAPVSPEKLRLLHEPDTQRAPRKASLFAKIGLRTGTGTVCFRIGPYPDIDIVTRTERRLNDLALSYSRRQEETRTITGYLVYLPPLSSLEAVERKRQELTRLGFRDHALIQEEGMQNAISLGVFTVEANAETRVRELAAKNVPARMQPFELSRKRFWLDVSVPFPSDTLTKLGQMEWGVPVQEMACPADTNLPPGESLEARDNIPS
ncbi:MAG: hypothetical protein OEM48_09105 [Gammaproteobacteria bacterium]|nr:hypothetical protein [Gammaproteobacteria bacterium]MDH3370148.1 hypothetical protein [Gammaproteobacteria bacterium]MDH3407062.1 hypothetical protein [Gammaproteobacteria bacterium]MDH3562539.1 hypothetical protein [Gammaproteobacteria bacterium]MDH5487349.1 hypothetical protein [Gammaproteobacteria bacterium]